MCDQNWFVELNTKATKSNYATTTYAQLEIKLSKTRQKGEGLNRYCYLFILMHYKSATS